MVTFFIHGLIFKFENVSEKMKFMISSRPDMMNPMEVTLVNRELDTRYYKWAIFGPQYLKMKINMSLVAIIFK